MTERPGCGENRIKKKVQAPAIVEHLLISLASSHFFSDSSTTSAYNADAV